MDTLIAEGIGKSYKGRQVVRGVDLRISRGEVVGLLGPNGAGKTTSFYMIVGLVTPETGRVMVDQTDITRVPMYLRARNYGISYLPQEPSVFRKLTVEENIQAVLGAFAAHGGESLVYSATVWPVNWSESPVFQQVYGRRIGSGGDAPGQLGAEPRVGTDHQDADRGGHGMLKVEGLRMKVQASVSYRAGLGFSTQYSVLSAQY